MENPEKNSQLAIPEFNEVNIKLSEIQGLPESFIEVFKEFDKLSSNEKFNILTNLSALLFGISVDSLSNIKGALELYTNRIYISIKTNINSIQALREKNLKEVKKDE